MNDLAASPSAPKLSRAAVVSLGVCAMLVGFLIIPVFPFVVAAVMAWWLTDDLRRSPSSRPGWLGIVVFVVFTLVAVVSVTFVTILDVDVSCGRNLFESARDAETFDQECASAQRWRSVVAVSLTLVACGLGFYGVRRSDESQSPLAVAARTVGVMSLVVVGVTTILVVT